MAINAKKLSPEASSKYPSRIYPILDFFPLPHFISILDHLQKLKWLKYIIKLWMDQGIWRCQLSDLILTHTILISNSLIKIKQIKWFLQFLKIVMDKISSLKNL